jgi:hypothetical protein
MVVARSTDANGSPEMSRAGNARDLTEAVLQVTRNDMLDVVAP